MITWLRSPQRIGASLKRIEDLRKPFLNELEKLFVNYHRLRGAEFRILAAKGPIAARRAIKRTRAKPA